MREGGFTAEDLVPPDEVDMRTIRPFRQGEFIDNQDGTHSTERTTSQEINGKEVVMPTLWMTPNGPVDLSRLPDSVRRSVIEFERRTNKQFPRFNSIEEANAFSKDRTKKGGISTGELER